MASGADWNKDIPWLGAWIPLCFVLVGVGAALAWVGVPMFVLGVVGPFVVAGVYLYFWGPRGRLTQPPTDGGKLPLSESDPQAN